MKKIQRITAFIICLFVVLSGSYVLGQRMMPDRNDFGATWGHYLAEPKNSVDVLFIGSSIAYCDIKPSIIYNEKGITSYMVCGPELTSSFSYYYLKEALKTQSPQAVMVEATSFFFGEFTGYTKVNAGYMPFSANRIGAIFRASEKDQRLGLAFPLYNYHSRWNDEKVTYKGKREDCSIDMNAGYTFVDEISPQEERSERNYYLSDEQLEKNLRWLKRIEKLCSDKDIDLVLFIAPQCKYPSDELVSAVRDAAADVKLINYNDDFEKLGLDISKDFHDSLHLNCYGADKFSPLVADTLESLGIIPSNTQAELWEERIEYEMNRNDR